MRILDLTIYPFHTYMDSRIKSKGIASTWFSAHIMIASHIDKENRLLDTLQPEELIYPTRGSTKIPLG